MQSKALTVGEYIEELPVDRKKAIVEIRKAILDELPKGFEENMSYGMIGYVVPHSLYPKGYHCDPKQALPFISLASQKNYISLYHVALYNGPLLNWFKEEWQKYSDKKPDMGKCCIRFKKPGDIPLKLIGALAAKMSPQEWIAQYEEALKNK